MSDDRIIGAVADVTQDKDDSDIDDPKAAPIILYTDGAKALEMALCYVEEQALASSIDVMLLKKWQNYAVSHGTSSLQQKKKSLIFYKLSS